METACKCRLSLSHVPHFFLIAKLVTSIDKFFFQFTVLYLSIKTGLLSTYHLKTFGYCRVLVRSGLLLMY